MYSHYIAVHHCSTFLSYALSAWYPIYTKLINLLVEGKADQIQCNMRVDCTVVWCLQCPVWGKR